MILVPEVQYYFNNFVISSTLTKYSLPFPSTFDSKYLEKGSVIELLFNDNWPKSQKKYNYLLRKIPLTSCPQSLVDKIGIYSQKASVYTCSNLGTYNILNIKSDDLQMLDLLLGYRIDSTSISISNIEFDLLGTSLSKLVFLYLDLKINSSYDRYNNSDTLSSTLLELMYESYVLDKMFQFVSDKGS